MTLNEKTLISRAIKANVINEWHQNYWLKQYDLPYNHDALLVPSPQKPKQDGHNKRVIQSEYWRQDTLIKNFIRLKGGKR